MKLKVKDNERLVRDSSNLAILNTDHSAIKKHEMKMQQIARQKQQEEQINTLKNEVSEIKSLLQELLKRV